MLAILSKKNHIFQIAYLRDDTENTLTPNIHFFIFSHTLADDKPKKSCLVPPDYPNFPKLGVKNGTEFHKNSNISKTSKALILKFCMLLCYDKLHMTVSEPSQQLSYLTFFFFYFLLDYKI